MLGVWAALAVAATTVAFAAAAAVSGIAAPLPEWDGIATFAAAFRAIHTLPDIAALLLAPAFVVLVVALHLVAAEHQKAFTLTGLGFAVAYAAIVFISLAAWTPLFTVSAVLAARWFALGGPRPQQA